MTSPATLAILRLTLSADESHALLTATGGLRFHISDFDPILRLHELCERAPGLISLVEARHHPDAPPHVVANATDYGRAALRDRLSHEPLRSPR